MGRKRNNQAIVMSDDDEEKQQFGYGNDNGANNEEDSLPSQNRETILRTESQGDRIVYTIEHDPVEHEEVKAREKSLCFSQPQFQDANSDYQKEAKIIFEESKKRSREFLTLAPEKEGSMYAYQFNNYEISQRTIRDGNGVCCGRTAEGKLVVTSSVEEYHHTILPKLANDISNKIICTMREVVQLRLSNTPINEIFHKPSLITHRGMRLFTKLHYGSFRTLPSNKLVLQHIEIAHTLARECFKDYFLSSSCETELFVRESPTHLKFPNRNSTITNKGLPMLRKYYILHWPNIVVYDANVIREFCTTLDMRLTRFSPQYPNPVDCSLLRPKSRLVSLYLVYAHKVVPCLNCSVLSHTMGEYETSDEEHACEPQSSPSSSSSGLLCVQCKNTRKTVSPIFTQPFGYMGSVDNKLVFTTYETTSLLTIDEHIRHFSIIPDASIADATSCSTPFYRPSDLPSSTDAFGFNCALTLYSPFAKDNIFDSDKNNKLLDKVLQMKTTVRLDAHDHPELFRLCATLIAQVGRFAPTAQQDADTTTPNTTAPLPVLAHHEMQDQSIVGPYGHLAITTITMQSKKKMLYVNVQGRGSCYCMLHQGEHVPSARIYFVISPYFYNVSVFCNDSKCQKIIFDYFEKKRLEREINDGNKKNHTELIARYNNLHFSEQQEEKLRSMRFEISVESGLREPLLKYAFNENYCGLKTNVVKLHPCATNNTDAKTTASTFTADETCTLDPSIGLVIPLRYHQSSLREKLAYLVSQSKQRKKKAELSHIGEGPITLSAIDLPPPKRARFVFDTDEHALQQWRYDLKHSMSYFDLNPSLFLQD